jgi:hypothetical protein
MLGKHHDLRGLIAVLLLAVFVCSGCSSVRPSAAREPVEHGGGLSLSEEGGDFLAFFGPAFYFLGEWLAGWSAGQR